MQPCQHSEGGIRADVLVQDLTLIPLSPPASRNDTPLRLHYE